MIPSSDIRGDGQYMISRVGPYMQDLNTEYVAPDLYYHVPNIIAAIGWHSAV